MLVAADFRERARYALQGKWGIAVLTGILASLLGGSNANGKLPSFNININQPPSVNTGFQGVFDSYVSSSVPAFIYPLVGGILIVGVLMIMVQLIIGGAVSLGYAQFNLNLIDGKNPELGNLFDRFNIFWKAFCLMLLRGIYTLLWTLLFIIPGIIASYSYAMSPYILTEHPELEANEAITISKQMMEGNRWRLFCLHFSFIGWSFLCIFTLGIGMLWLVPYMEASNAAFYRDVSAHYHFPETNCGRW